MDQKLTQELKKKDAETQEQLQQAKKKIQSETKRFEETQKVQEIAEIHSQNKKRVKQMTEDLKQKQVELDNANDRASEMSNKLNDIQAAAWFKDQKIQKITTEESSIKR